MNRAAILASAMLLAGCPVGDKGNDSGPGGGSLLITYVSVGCDENDVVRFFAETNGLTADGVAFAQETGNSPPNWSDSITLESYEFDPDGNWDRLEHTLTTGIAFEDYVQNVNTVFTCDAHFDVANGVMSYAFGVYDLSGNLADCLMYGDNPGVMQAGSQDRINEPDWDLSICEEGVPAR